MTHKPLPPGAQSALCIFDPASEELWVNDLPPKPRFSHDNNLLQFAHELLRLGATVFFTTSAEYDRHGVHGRGDARQVLEIYPTLRLSTWKSPISAVAPQICVAVHPQTFVHGGCPDAKKVAIHPALYFVEMPDTYDAARTRSMLLSLRYHIDYLVVQNPRMKDLAGGLYHWLAGWNDLDRILVASLGIVPEMPHKVLSRASCRRMMGIDNADLVFVNGGGVWRWTGFNEFLLGFIDACRAGTTKVKLVMTGLKQTSNKDHTAYIAETRAILQANADLLRTSEGGKKAWFIHVEEDWEKGSEAISTLLGCADIGLNINRDGLEDWQSHRVRCLDYIRYGLPILSNGGDWLSENAARDATIQILAPSRAGYTAAITSLADNRQLVERAKQAVIAVQEAFDSRSLFGTAARTILDGSKYNRNLSKQSILEYTWDRWWALRRKDIKERVVSLVFDKS
jgi:hypothetical protein